MNIKEILYKKCIDYVEKRVRTIQNSVYEIQNSLLSETKSSAGDKHETGRAMLQLEREKAGKHLAVTQKLEETLSKMDISITSKNICLGSVVYSNHTNYFISISAGKLTIDNTDFFAISPLTPIAQLLLSKQVDDEISFREKKFTIKEIL